MKTQTLKEKVSQISVGVFVLTIALMLTCFTLYSMKKAKISEELIVKELSQNIESQSARFIPSFLLPEQRQGVELILSRMKSGEGLSDALILKDSKELPLKFSNCLLNPEKITNCASRDLNETAIVSPLNESGAHFGYLFKSKVNTSPSSLRSVIEMVGIIVLILSTIFFFVYMSITRLLARTLPLALDELVQWIEADLDGKSNNDITLPFQELEDLKFKISEVMDRYNKSRDQAVIGQLTSGIMHDIRTPLQSIVTSMHLVDEQEASSPKRSSRLENEHLMCKTNLPIILNIIESTLDGNRQIKIDKQELDLSKSLSKVIEMNKDYSRLRNVTIITQNPTNISVGHDPVQFSRVLSNLVRNSVEAASESPEMKLVKLSVSETSESVLIQFEDSGPGIIGRPDSIFRAFRTSKARGTGLGLLITKKIVEAHGGTIKASNTSSIGGALFEVRLPKTEVGVMV